MKEFNLSEKETFAINNCYSTKDVNRFIRLLKDEIVKCDCNHCQNIMRRLEELAGDKLI